MFGVLVFIAVALTAHPHHPLQSHSHQLEEERVVMHQADKSAIDLAKVWSTAREDIVATKVVLHCRDTILRLARALGGKHCGLIFHSKKIGEEEEMTDRLYVDLGLGDMFYRRMDEVPRDAELGLRSSIFTPHIGVIDPKVVPTRGHVADIFARWVARDAQRPIDLTQHHKDYDLTAAAITEKQLIYFLLSYNHHFPYYSAGQCDCLLMIVVLLRTFMQYSMEEARPGVRPNVIGRMVQKIMRYTDKCRRHASTADDEEARWNEEYTGGAAAWLEAMNLGGFDLHANAIHSDRWSAYTSGRRSERGAALELAGLRSAVEMGAAVSSSTAIGGSSGAKLRRFKLTRSISVSPGKETPSVFDVRLAKHSKSLPRLGGKAKA